MRVKKGEAVAINGIFAGEKREGEGGKKIRNYELVNFAKSVFRETSYFIAQLRETDN